MSDFTNDIAYSFGTVTLLPHASTLTIQGMPSEVELAEQILQHLTDALPQSCIGIIEHSLRIDWLQDSRLLINLNFVQHDAFLPNPAAEHAAVLDKSLN